MRDPPIPRKGQEENPPRPPAHCAPKKADFRDPLSRCRLQPRFHGQSRSRPGLDAKSIDIDAAAVAESRKAFFETCFEAISAEDYAARGDQANVVYTAEVIEHVHDPDGFVALLKARSARRYHGTRPGPTEEVEKLLAEQMAVEDRRKALIQQLLKMKAETCKVWTISSRAWDYKADQKPKRYHKKPAPAKKAKPN